MKRTLFSPLQIILSIVGYFYATTTTQAQVTTDSTVNTQVNQNGNVAEITGGETRGSNLFHSFQDFSVGTGNEAFFNNASDISNIFSRVTGGNISNIDGVIRNNGSASLFLINPAGIIFGANARLDIGGSFYGSTASSILFEDGKFSAVDNINEPILSINAPIGLDFRDNPGDIELNQSELSSGSDIALVGGDINFDQGKVFAPNIQLGGLAEAGTIDFNSDDGFNFPDTVALTDTSLINNSFLGIFGTTGGSISVNANNITHTDKSNIQVDVENDVNLTSGNNILFDNNSIIIAQVSSDQPGDTGDINVFAQGNITFNNDSLIINQVLSDAIGDAGNIDIKANSLDLRNDSLWISDTSGNGNGGNISIDVTNQMTLNEGSLILSQVRSGARGNAGDIDITVGSLILNNGLIIADSSDLGDGGNINISADGDIVLQGTPNNEELAEDLGNRPSQIVTGLNESIDTETDTFESAGQGNAGSINISANKLIMRDRAFVISNIEENTVGDGGKISFDVDLLRLENNAFVSTYTESTFKAGSINVDSQNLELVSGGKLITSTDGSGSAGTINLNITDNISIDNAITPSIPRIIFDDAVLTELQGRSGLFANATTRATGNGGNIIIGQDLNSPITDITIANGGEVRADGGIKGEAGNIFISADSLSLESDAVIVAETLSAQGANINLQLASNITFDNNSLISARSFNQANGGNINIDANFVIAFPNQVDGNGNDIIASAGEGNGGNITINANSLLGISERKAITDNNLNDIDASSEFGLDGNVSIFTPDSNAIEQRIELPQNVIQSEQISTQACNANRETVVKNDFTIKGKGGIPPEPGLPLNSQNIFINGEINSNSTIPEPIETSQGKIQPARGIKVTESGKIILTAYRTNNSGERTPEIRRNCGQV